MARIVIITALCFLFGMSSLVAETNTTEEQPFDFIIKDQREIIRDQIIARQMQLDLIYSRFENLRNDCL